MLTGDTGETAVLAKEGRLDEARLRLLHPIKFMLASPAEDAADVLARLGPTVWAEDKYDGIRAQLHRRGAEVRLYSRDLHDISEQFPEIVEAARPLDWDGILDGEILAYSDGRVLPFLTLQGRLGRKEPTADVQAEVPVAYVAFDLLAIGPRSGLGDDSPNGYHSAGGAAGHLNGAFSGHSAGGVPGRNGATPSVVPLLQDSTGRAPRPPRGPGPADGGGGRPIRAVSSGHRRFGRSTRPRLRRGPRPAQRGSDGQGPTERLFAGATGSWLAQDEARPGDPGLRRGGRRSRPRQNGTASCRTTRSPFATNRPIVWSRSARPTPA